MTTDIRVRVLCAALYVASAAATQPRLDSPPSLRKKLEGTPFLRGAVGGAAYGLAAAAISHPFDTVKTRLQTKAAVGGGSVLSRMLGLYSGIGPAAAASMLFRAVPFVGYEATRSLLRSHRLLVTDRDSSLGATDTQRLTPRSCLVLCQESQPALAALLGGMVGGVMRGCVETPAELLKTRLQVGLQVGAGLGSASLLLRGLRSTCLRNAAVTGLFWLAYEASAESNPSPKPSPNPEPSPKPNPDLKPDSSPEPDATRRAQRRARRCHRPSPPSSEAAAAPFSRGPRSTPSTRLGLGLVNPSPSPSPNPMACLEQLEHDGQHERERLAWLGLGLGLG